MEESEGIKICEFTGKQYKGTRVVDCTCECHEKGSNMVHIQACCDDGKTEERIYLNK